MLKTKLYIIQFLFMIALICGYFLGDHPDSLSEMHFDSTTPLTLNKAGNQQENFSSFLISNTENDISTSELQVYKHINFELAIIIKLKDPDFIYYPNVSHTIQYQHGYEYLYFKEINPPPPKFC